MVTATPFTIGKVWKKPKCLTDELVKKNWCIHTHTHTHTHMYTRTHIYTGIRDGILLSHKKNEIMPYAATWIDLKIIVQSEISHIEKDKYHMISLICGI